MIDKLIGVKTIKYWRTSVRDRNGILFCFFLQKRYSG